MSSGVTSPVSRARRSSRRRSGLRGLSRATLAGGAIVLAVLLVLGVAFAGSPQRIADGVHVGGIDVGGMTPSAARELLERRSAAVADVPVEFVAGSFRQRLTPAQLGVEVNWAAAVEVASREAQGFLPLRGFRRLHTRFFGAEVAPAVAASGPALEYAVGRIARTVDRAPQEAAVELRGLKPVVVPARSGRVLLRVEAERVIVRALASFSRAVVGLPVRVASPSVTAGELAPALAQTRTALASPVRLALAETRWLLPRWRIPKILQLPGNGTRSLAVAGPGADAYFDRLAKVVAKPARDADFAADAGGTVHVIPGVPGRALDRKATADVLLAALVRRNNRVAPVSVAEAEPSLTTSEARAMGISRILSSYTTPYAGTADRIHNLQLAISLLDGALVAPGKTFSLNERVGERTPERGFRVAPVIINGEYEEAVGGGTSQVATTVFNAAWEAGIKIAERNPHALYISRYPTGRDATVNYPDLDLRFLNDTDGWILVRGFSADTGITVSLWGATTGRRIVSEPGALVVTGPVPVKRIKDPKLAKGKTAVEEEGAPPRSVRVKRTVYAADGSVLYSETWATSYRGEKRIIRVGTKKPKPEQKKPAAEPDQLAGGVPPPPPSGEPELIRPGGPQ